MENKIKKNDRIRLSGTDRFGLITKIRGDQAKIEIVGESSRWVKIKDLVVEN